MIVWCARVYQQCSAISTESSHNCIIIKNFNIIWWCSLAIYVHVDERDGEIHSTPNTNWVSTACQIWVGIWIWRWSQNPSPWWWRQAAADAAFCEQFYSLILDVKSLSLPIRIPIIVCLKSGVNEKNATQYLYFLLCAISPHLIKITPRLAFNVVGSLSPLLYLCRIGEFSNVPSLISR